MTDPWSRNEGRFDQPSSSTFATRAAVGGQTRGAKTDYISRRLADAQHQGVIAAGADTIVTRINQAIERLRADGLGEPKAIYLTEPDMLAIREVTGSSAEYFDCRLALGAKSKVYGRNGTRAILKTVRR